MTTKETHKPVRAAQDELEVLSKVQTYLAEHSNRAVLMDEDERIELPDSLFEVLREAVQVLLDGNGVTIVPEDAELTTQEAANFLNVSRQYLVRLLEQEDIPYHMVGTHRRIYYKDLEEYRQKRDAKRRSILTDLAQSSREQGLYKEPDASEE